MSSLCVGALGFLWPGGPNILMIMGAVMLFGAAILDEDKCEKPPVDEPSDLEDE